MRCSEATQSFSRFDIIKDDLMNYFDEKIKIIIKVWRCDSPAGAGCRGLCLRKLLGVSLSRWGKSASNVSLFNIDIKNQPYLGNGLCYLVITLPINYISQMTFDNIVSSKGILVSSEVSYLGSETQYIASNFFLFFVHKVESICVPWKP